MVALAAALSVGAWLAWLGFHADYTTVPGTGRQTGPYEPWQVAGLALTLVVGTFALAWFGPEVPAVASGVLSLGVIAACDWGTQPDSDGLYAIGVMMLVIGAGAVGTGIAFGAPLLRGARER